jgi:hypothetical protein
MIGSGGQTDVMAAQQGIQRLCALDRCLVVAVQVDEQHSAAESALPPGGMPCLDRQRGFSQTMPARPPLTPPPTPLFRPGSAAQLAGPARYRGP